MSLEEKTVDNGDGTFSRVVQLAATPTIDVGDFQLLAGGALGEVQDTPTANTVLSRLKALLTGTIIAAGSAIIGKVGIDKTTQGVTNAVAPLSGVTASATFTPAAAAYGAGDIMDVAKQMVFTYADGTPVPAGSLIRILSAVIKIDVTAVPSGQTSYTLQTYNVMPPSAQADNDTWTLASGDLAAYRGDIPLGSPVDKGAALYVKQPYVDKDVNLTTTSLYAQLVTDGGHTAAAVARSIILYGIVL